jgi:uncharacterized protein YjbI with pentapeptide repeats
MIQSRETELEAAVEGMLSLARRETFVLATALQRQDGDSVLIAGGRLRWALACAHQFAGLSHATLSRMRPRLVSAVEGADRWLPQSWVAETDDLNPERLQRVLHALRVPSFGLPSICADDTLIAEFDLDGLPLSGIMLRGATIANVTARRARLDYSDVTKSHITRSYFESASFRKSVLDQAVLEACDLSKANLEQTRWRYASLAQCSAAGASFLDADVEGTSFVDCDLRSTDWQVSQQTSSRGAQFVRCDLRESKWAGRNLSGVSFIHCKLYGVHGQAIAIDEAVIEHADLSHPADRGRVGTRTDLLAMWQQDEWTDQSVLKT